MRERRTAPSNEAAVAHWTRLLAIATGLLVIVTALLAYIAYRTDETSRLRDRALIYFGDPTVGPYPLPPAVPVVWAAGIIVYNAGNMPARRVAIRYACPDAFKSASSTDPFTLAKWQNAEVTSVIGPKQALALQGCEIPVAKIDEAKRNLRDMFYLVEVTYIDGFDLSAVRTTQMSRNFRFDQNGGQSLGFLTTGNCSDEDCKKK
jgi:hypothetical protein